MSHFLIPQGYKIFKNGKGYCCCTDFQWRVLSKICCMVLGTPVIWSLNYRSLPVTWSVRLISIKKMVEEYNTVIKRKEKKSDYLQARAHTHAHTHQTFQWLGLYNGGSSAICSSSPNRSRTSGLAQMEGFFLKDLQKWSIIFYQIQSRKDKEEV